MWPDDYAFIVKTAKSPHLYARDPFVSKLKWSKLWSFLQQYPDGPSVLTTSRVRSCLFTEANANKFVREAPYPMVVECLSVFVEEKEISMTSDPRHFIKNREDDFVDVWHSTRNLIFVIISVLIAILAISMGQS